MDIKKIGKGKSFYQREPLTTRLKNLIHDYPEGVGIVKELIQNADDAGASCVHIIFDWRTHICNELPDTGMERLMGASMLVYNDSIFSDEDFDNIQNLGESGKKKALWKTGRFGVGFNSVYHVTDYPSFISRDRIVFFDPHASDTDAAPHAAAFQELTNGEAGRSWSLDEWWWNHPEFMQIYGAGGLEDMQVDFQGTLFRLPLRTEEHAKHSKIRNQSFTRGKNVKPLLDDLALVGEEFLVFLKSVVEIRVFIIEADGARYETFSIVTENANEVITERKKISKSLLGNPERFLEICQNQPDSLPSISYIHKIKTEIASNVNKEKQVLSSVWRIASLIRVDQHGEMLSIINELREQNEKTVPWAGAAARIESTNNVGKDKPFVGKSYCFLPLSESGLPVHVNGFFDLDSSRSKLTSGNMTGKDESRVRWNQLLVRHVLSYAYANLIIDLVGDVGKHDLNRFYGFWTIGEIKDKALEELPICLVKILDDFKVIATTNDQGWIEPCEIQVLPSKFQPLTEPLSLDGILLPRIPIPRLISELFKKADLEICTFLPENLREHLKTPNTLGIPLEKCSRASLRKLKWVKDLLHYCLNDGCRDLQDLPLAFLADGTLQVFGNNPSGYIYNGTDDVREVFATHNEWFIDPEFIESISVLKDCPCITDMDAVIVAERLADIIDADYYNNEVWEPDGNDLPNTKWLIYVYNYFAKQKALPDNLKEVLIVPSNDGKLHQGGNSLTPLWCDSGIDYDTRTMLAYFNIPLVEASKNLSREIKKFVDQHPENFIWNLTVPDLIDTLSSYKNNLPSYEKYFYDLLLTFLCDKGWFKGEGKDDTDRKEKLTKLQIYPTLKENLASIEDEDIFIAKNFIVPNIDLGVNFYKLGIDSEEWYPLFQFLQVSELDISEFISNYLVEQFPSLEALQQLEVMLWLRDNSQTILNNTHLKQLVGNASLFLCQDRKLYPINQLYSPNCHAIQQLHLINAPIVDIDFYASDEENQRNWLHFFEGIGMYASISPQQVAYYLQTIVNWNEFENKQWEPQGNFLPNSEWLASIYNYFSNQDEIPDDELRGIPLVPGNDGKLHYGGSPSTPLWSNTSLSDDVKKMLAYFHVPVIDADDILKPAITKFFSNPSQYIIFAITNSDLIDTLDNMSKSLPAYGQHNRKHYKTLVNFLADQNWIEGDGKEDKDRHKLLRQLKIYLTTSNDLVSLVEPNVFILGADDVPEIPTSFKLLQLGYDNEKQNWQPLFQLLNVPILNRVKLIKDFLLPMYLKCSQTEQKKILQWIRDNLTLAQSEQEKLGDTSNDLKKLVRETPLILCEDNIIRAASSIYYPQNYDFACEILGDRAHTINTSFYIEDRWKEFFRNLGMRYSLSPNDVRARVESLINLPRREESDSSLMRIFSHVIDDYKRISEYKFFDTKETLIDFLKKSSWLPVELNPNKLQNIPCYRNPEKRLYNSANVCLPRFVLSIASQRPVFIIKEPDKEVRESLGFREPDKHEIVNHLKALISFWNSPELQISNDLEKNFQKSLQQVYQYLINIFVKASDAEKMWLRNELSDSKCLWDYSQFWEPRHTFQVPVPFFGKHRSKINDPKTRDIYVIIGQKYEPDLDDYLLFINDLAALSQGKALQGEDVKCAYEVLQRISKLLESKSISSKNLNDLLLLTDDCLLLPPEQIFIPDSTIRLKAIGVDRVSIKIIYREDLWLLGSTIGCPSLRKDVDESPKLVTPSIDSEPLRFCRQWQKLMGTPEFTEGIERLIADEYGFEEVLNIDFSSIKDFSISASAEILTDLIFKGNCIASEVPGNYFFDDQENTFYLRSAKENIMRRYLSESLNLRLAEIDYSVDKSNLNVLLESSNPKDIEQSLDELGITSYKKINIINTQSEEIGIEEDAVFDNEFSDDDFIGIFDSSENETKNEVEQVHTKEISQASKSETSNTTLVNPNISLDKDVEQNSNQSSGQIQPSKSISNPVTLSQGTSNVAKSDVAQSNRNSGQSSSTASTSRSQGSPRQPVVSPQRAKNTSGSSQNQQYRNGVRVSSGLTIEKDSDSEEILLQVEIDKIDQAGVARVINYEREQGRNPMDKNEEEINFPGYDIESQDSNSGEIRYIEVKSLRHNWGRKGVKVTNRQFKTGEEYKDSYWLYVVERAEFDGEYEITTIQNPVGLVREYYYDGSWKQLGD